MAEEYNGKHSKPKKPRKSKNKRKLWPTILAVLMCLLAAGVVSACVMVGITAVRVGDINADTLYDNIEQTSYVYDTNGDPFDELHYIQNRKIVSIDEMPDDLKNAFVAASGFL